MLYLETNKYWKKFSSTVALLAASGRKEPIVIALLATESFFRPSIHRTFESFYWYIMDFVSPKKSEYISVGISQVQVRHWRAAGIISRKTSKVSALMKFYNPLLNYDACRYVVNTTDGNHEEPEAILHVYTGQTTDYHISIFKQFLESAVRLTVRANPSSLTRRFS